jgi:hypothetical protein
MDCWWTPDLRRSLGMDTAPLIETIRLVCRQYGSFGPVPTVWRQPRRPQTSGFPVVRQVSGQVARLH